MSIEQNYSIGLIASLALREKQIQQNYRPIIAVHKWFARRPGTLFRGLLLSEFGGGPVEQTYYRPNAFEGVTIADPFMGGGTPLLEANRLGCNVIGTDINPMATWVVREEMDAIDLRAYAEKAAEVVGRLSEALGHLYRTKCPVTGRTDAWVKYYLWVKTATCAACRRSFDLFPGYVLAEDSRHTSYVLVCPACGDLNEVADPARPGACGCGGLLTTDGPVSRNRCACPHCGHVNSAPFHGEGPPPHRLFAIEYHNPDLESRPGRLFKKPDEDDLARVREAEAAWQDVAACYVPDDPIPEGDESSRLLRWGYRRFRELFNARQLLGLETSARLIGRVEDLRIRRALATNLSDLLRYQNMLCRYDTWALKSLDIFSIHGFPVGYVQVESNLLGLRKGSALPVGSGGWTNIIEKYAKAKRYCTAPFEMAFEGRRKTTVPIRGEWIGATNPQRPEQRERRIDIRCAAATSLDLGPATLDGVFTDPPYYGMVQYGELMHFCYVWLRKLMGQASPGLERDTTRNADELTGNATAERGLEHFAEGLADVYTRMARALKPGAPLVFTYHHNQQDAYLAVGMAILDAGLTCSASLPCPAEMGGSIHIHGTGSSIVDTVFVCRDRGVARRAWLFHDADGLAVIMAKELVELRSAGMKPTAGDIRCAALGHITRMAIWCLRPTWDAARPTATKLQTVRKAMDALARVEQVAERLQSVEAPPAVADGLFAWAKEGERADAVAF
ncbi:MAG: DNA methylase [Chthonomonadales bacterium]|nr:DNA methylase [Chthonomonadales bacterium]